MAFPPWPLEVALGVAWLPTWLPETLWTAVRVAARMQAGLPSPSDFPAREVVGAAGQS